MRATQNAVIISPAKKLTGTLPAPPDKSCSHRALILCALAGGGEIYNLSNCLAVRKTIACLRQLGIGVKESGRNITVSAGEFSEPALPLDCGGSATTMRLLMGALAGLPVNATLTGDAGLLERPMEHIVKALRKMGADIKTHDGNPPIAIRGRKLHATVCTLEKPSAQLKSAIILAALRAEGETRLAEPVKSRDHTERMLEFFSYPIKRRGSSITITGGQRLHSKPLHIPGDISSASFFAAAAAIIPGSSLVLKNIGLNPGRTGFMRALKKTGADVRICPSSTEQFEPIGDITVRHSPLKAIRVDKDEIPGMIDEIPLLAVVAAQAQGMTVINGLGELRGKESDRIASICAMLSALGVRCEAAANSIKIHGPSKFRACKISSYGDHRIVMAASIAALAAEGPCEICDPELAEVSYPDFYRDLNNLTNAQKP